MFIFEKKTVVDSFQESQVVNDDELLINEAIIFSQIEPFFKNGVPLN